MGIVGAGFVGPHHVDAVRRLGFVDVVAVAGSSEASAKAKAEALGAARAYGSYEALLDDPDVQVVHNATPNYLHYPVNAAAIAKGKHVVSDKPLAMTAAEGKKLLDAANKAGIVHAVTFNYRGNPLVQQARHAIARGDIGKPHFLVGQYLQDWLLKDTDYSWRLEPDKGGASSALGDIGSHWCDLAQHISGLRITEVLGDITTVIPKRKKPRGSREAFQQGGGDEQVDLVDIKVEDLASVLLRFDNGARGSFSVGQVCARPQERSDPGDLRLEVLPALAAGAPERAVARTSRQGQRNPAEGSVPDRRRGAPLRTPARRPPGIMDGRVLEPDARYLRVHRRREEAQRPASSGVCDVRRRLPRQLHRRGDSRERKEGQRVDEGELLMATQAFDPKFMKVGVLTAALQELTPREVRDPDPDRAIEEWVEFARELGADYIQLSAALHPTETDVPPEAMLDPVANTLDLRKPFDKDARRAGQARAGGQQGRTLGRRLFRQPAASRPGRAPEEARVHAAHVRRRGAARRRRGLRLRRPQLSSTPWTRT